MSNDHLLVCYEEEQKACQVHRARKRPRQDLGPGLLTLDPVYAGLEKPGCLFIREGFVPVNVYQVSAVLIKLLGWVLWVLYHTLRSYDDSQRLYYLLPI